ncbi:MAG: hypothetical protein WBC44_01670 [Planctomycetaceae bacterium]
MPRLFVGNFDFEHRFGREGTLPRHLVEINAALAPVWATIADDGDAVWTPTPIDLAIFDRLARQRLPRLTPVAEPQMLDREFEFVFWGENEWARSAAQRWGRTWLGCEPDIVRRVNSRRFKFELERRFDVLPDGAALVGNVEELATALTLQANDGWVLKAEFGGAGREVRFGAGPPSKQDLAWASNRFRQGVVVTVERRLERLDEAGIQFHVERNGDVVCLGVTPLLTRPTGGYLGSGFDDEPQLCIDWAQAVEVGRRVAEAVAAEGYFGPLGIDAMRYRDAAGAIRVRPLQDLNARYTMGGLALGLRRFPAFAAASQGVFRIDEFRARFVGL